jgi:hypothetical protein
VCDLSLAGLRPREPPPDDDPGRGRMHPPLAPPRPAAGGSTHPALRVLGQPCTAGPTHAVSSAAAAPGGLIACQRASDRQGRGRGGSAPQDCGVSRLPDRTDAGGRDPFSAPGSLGRGPTCVRYFLEDHGDAASCGLPGVRAVSQYAQGHVCPQRLRPPVRVVATYGEALGRAGGGLSYAPPETAPVCVSLAHAGKTILRDPPIPITPQLSSTPSIRNAQSASLLQERSCCLSTPDRILSIIRSRAGAETRRDTAPKRERGKQIPLHTYGGTML